MAKSKAMCRGCRNDYYNHDNKSLSGECWMFAKAKVVKKVSVGTWQPPPYPRRPIPILSCYHCQGSSFLDLDDCRIVRGKAKVK